MEVNWDGQRVGDMAFHVRRSRAFTYIKMPPLTRSMSPRLSPPTTSGTARLIQSEEIVRELYAKLPRCDRFERALEINCPSVQGFTHAGLAVTHFFTLRSAPGEGPEELLLRARPKARQLARRAARECEVERSLDIDRFIALHQTSFAYDNYVDHDALRRIFEAASSRGQAEILFTKQDSVDIAAIVLVWDTTTTYCWVVARRRDVGEDGSATRLVFVEALRGAHARGTVLDIDGYARPEVGVMLMKLGFEPVSRPYVNGSSRLWLAFWAARTLMRPRNSSRHYAVP